VLGQIQVDSIERLLSRPAPDMHRAIEDAEAQIDSELNRASDPRIREQLGEANEDKVELDRATAAVLAEKEHGVALDVFLRRAVLAAGGSVETRDNALYVVTPAIWRSHVVLERYDGLLPPGSFRPGDESAEVDVLHEEHPLLESAVRWVRSTRFRKDDDHRLACVVVPQLAEQDLIATFLVTLQDGTAAKLERFEAVRVSHDLQSSRAPAADEEASRVTFPGNVASGQLSALFDPWWQEARLLAESEARRRAMNWKPPPRSTPTAGSPW